MALNYLCFICITPVLSVNPPVEGCTLVGLDLQNCLFPSTQTQFSLESCCKTLDRALESGCYCLRSLLDPSNLPTLHAELALSFSICYISLPSLNHCHGKI
ncbi:hypothetical protein ACS0TY_023213 [Phlomoides rotata]